MRKTFAAALFCALFCISALAQTNFSLLPVPRIQFLDANGVPLAGGQVYTYAAGTTTPLATYTDSTGNVQQSNPIILDAGGFPPNGTGIWLSANAYKIVVYNSNGALQWSQDGVSDSGQLLKSNVVLLNPAGNALQTIAGPLSVGNYSLTAGSVNGGSIVASAYNISHVMCDQSAGSTADAKIAACIATVTANGGGIADATGITGAQTWSSTVTLTGGNIQLWLGAATFTSTARPSLKLIGNGSEVLSVIGLGSDANATHFVTSGVATGEIIDLGDGTDPHAASRALISGLYLDGNSVNGCIYAYDSPAIQITRTRLVNCTGFDLKLKSSGNSTIGPLNVFGVVPVTSGVAAIVIDTSSITHIFKNQLAPVNVPAIRLTGTASNNIRSEQNDYQSETYAFQLPTMAVAIYAFQSESDSIEGASSGWADIGTVSDGGALAPANLSFKHLAVPSSPTTAATTVTAATNLMVEDSYIYPATTINTGVTSSLRDNTWVTGLTNNGTFSDLSSGQLVVAGLKYGGSAPANSGAKTAGTGAGSGWTNPGNVANATLASQVIATATNGTTSYLLGTNYSFAIPSGASIVGLQVTFQRKVTTATNFAVQTSATNGVCLYKGGASTGTCKTGSVAWTSGQVTETWGNSTDLWGATLTPTDINASGFGFEVQVDYNNTTGGNQTLSLGDYQITVYYVSAGTLTVGSQTINGASLLASSGYTYLPSGVILEWGITTSITGPGNQAVTYPLACPTAVVSAMITPNFAGSGSQAHDFVQTVTTTGLTVVNSSGANGAFYWSIVCY